MSEGTKRVRRLERKIQNAVEDHGAEVVVGTLEDALDGLYRGTRTNEGRDPDVPERPKSADYSSRSAFRAAMDEWRRARAEAVGPAIRRGKTPGVVTRGPDDEPRTG